MMTNLAMAMPRRLMPGAFLFFLGCSDSSTIVRATHTGGISLDSSMVLAVGNISGDHAKGFRRDLSSALQNGGFRTVTVTSEKDDAADSALGAAMGSLPPNQVLLILRGTYTIDKEESKIDAGNNNQDPAPTEKKVKGMLAFEITNALTHELLLARNLERDISERETPNLQSLMRDFASIFGGGSVSDPLEHEVRKKVIDGFIDELHPHEESFYVKFFKASDIPELETGISYAAVGNWDKAIEIYSSAISRNPNNENIHCAYYDLGICYKCQNKFTEARQNLEKAYVLKNSPEYLEQIQSLPQMEQEYRMRGKNSPK